MHIKAVARGACDGHAMTDIGAVLASTIACARSADWPRYRAELAALRQALEQSAAGQQESVRRQLDILAAAAPEHDAAGCIAELMALREALGAGALAAPAAAGPAPMDLRGLRPPEPIMRILQALERSPDTPLRVILPHEPRPLYDLLGERGFRCSGAWREAGGFEVLIERVA